jgi:hypothetical protein
VRNLLTGCRTSSEIRQRAPGISTALLAQRLKTLEHSGVLVGSPQWIPHNREHNQAILHGLGLDGSFWRSL